MTGCDCSESWKNFEPAPIERFHGEAGERFHQIAKLKHTEIFGQIPKTIDGIQFNRILAEFKVKIMKEYNITSDAIHKSGEEIK